MLIMKENFIHLSSQPLNNNAAHVNASVMIDRSSDIPNTKAAVWWYIIIDNRTTEGEWIYIETQSQVKHMKLIWCYDSRRQIFREKQTHWGEDLLY